MQNIILKKYRLQESNNIIFILTTDRPYFLFFIFFFGCIARRPKIYLVSPKKMKFRAHSFWDTIDWKWCTSYEWTFDIPNNLINNIRELNTKFPGISCTDEFCKDGFFKTFWKFTGKHLCWNLFLTNFSTSVFL